MVQLRVLPGGDRGGAAKLGEHPCFSADAHSRYGRMHVPVAPRCNIQCTYCVRKFDCANENRPGVTTRVMTPGQAVLQIARELQREPRLRVLGVAGPGDALANEPTFQLFELARERFPQLSLCLSTNGLLLPDRLHDVVRAGVQAVTVTINAVDPAVGRQLYSRIRHRRTTYRGEEAFRILSRYQLEGVRLAARAGITVKVNSVLVPGVNDHHLVEVARLVKALGAHVHNVIPVIPMGDLAWVPEPTDDDVRRVRAACAEVIGQFEHCLRCRADAVGVPGEEGCSAPGYGGRERAVTSRPRIHVPAIAEGAHA